MSNKKAREKTLDVSSNVRKSVWIQLAEDAETDANKSLIRSRQLKEAAKIFREGCFWGAVARHINV
jgi:hypothetical protein